ncbi:MAG: zinc-ribbon domain-containing protein [Candidatus Hodarchaeales archaeon]
MAWPCPKCGNEVTEYDNFCPNCGFNLQSMKHKHQPVTTSKVEEYKSYIQILGIIEIAFGIFSLVIALLTFISVLFVFPFPKFATGSAYIPIITLITAVFVILIIIYGTLSITFGRQLLQYKNSGRLGTMIIGAISLMAMPFGTAFGIAALYILTKPEVEPLFS